MAGLDNRKLITVFGGSGFLGTQLVQRLARRGHRIRVAVRRPDLAGEVRMFGFPGQIQPIQANVRDDASVARAVVGADAVVNLTGILFERARQRFAAVHVDGAARVARAAQAAGAARLVHVSALGADPGAASAYGRTKAAGEAGVLAAYPGAVILRPSIVFGPDDDFFNRFAGLARLLPVLPVVGAKTRMQPVYVGDVAEALALAALGTGKGGRVYELGGPQIETMRQIMERVLAETGRNNLLLPLPAGLARALAVPLSLLPKPVLTRDQVAQLQVDNVVSEAALREKRTLAAFGITATGMDAILPSYLWRFRKRGQFDRQTA